jgi:hypothetical protein
VTLENTTMNFTKSLIYVLFAVLLASGLPNGYTLQASEAVSADQAAAPKVKRGRYFQSSDDPLAAVASKRNSALQSGKLLLVVMGANWCHDSRALATRLHKKPLKAIVNENYEIVYVDVGYLDKGRDVINSLGPPVYYATPTVLVIDPVSGLLVNEQNMHQWGDAANISMEESIEYFQLMADTDLESLRSSNEIGPELQRLRLEIDAFEQIQAERLYQAYEILGPMLEADARGERDKFSNKLWDEVRKFRLKVALDVNELSSEAQRQVAAGDNDIRLNYPTYPAFSWE